MHGITVVVPVFNRAASVIEALDSIARQSRLPDTVVVVDDGSTDGSADAVARWIHNRPTSCEVRLIRQANHGAPHARNQGMAATPDCHYFAFLDSDDLWPRNFLAETAAVLDNDDTGAIAASCDQTYVSLATGEFQRESLAGIGDDATRWLFENKGGVTCCTLFRADAIRAMGGFNETLPTGQDLDLFLQLSLQGRWRYVPGLQVTIHRGLHVDRGEEINLSDKYADRFRRWVQIEEDFVQEKGGREALPDEVFQAKLSSDWFRAGKDLLRQGEVAGARDCLRRAERLQRR